MADISATNVIKPQGFEFQSAVESRAYVLEPLAQGVEATGTHLIVPIGEGEVFLGADFIVEDSFTSGGSATLQFKIGSDTLTGAIPVANLVAGDVGKIGGIAATAITTYAGYAKAAADTLDIAVATAALTAGKMIVICNFLSTESRSALTD